MCLRISWTPCTPVSISSFIFAITRLSVGKQVSASYYTLKIIRTFTALLVESNELYVQTLHVDIVTHSNIIINKIW